MILTPEEKAARSAAVMKYNKSRALFSIRPTKEDGEKIKAAAKAASQSCQAYILQAIRARMKADASGMYLVCLSKEDAQSLADSQGQNLADWLGDHQ